MSDSDRTGHLNTLESRNLNGNFTAFDPNGEFLFICDSKKANWYIRKNLADWINDEKTHFKLNFTPKGNGNRGYGKYFTEYVVNQCVICGVKENLTKHHVVPSCYKTHFPHACKSNDHFDVLLICVDCHEKIERFYDKRKDELRKHHSGQLQFKYNKVRELNSLIRTCRKQIDFIDETGKELMVKKANAIKPEIDTFEKLFNEELIEVGGSIDNEVCELVVKDNQDDLKNFIVSWRELFLEYGQPQFMPNGWLEDYKTHFKF